MKIERIALNEYASITAFAPDPEIGYKFFRRRPAIILAPGGAYLMHATREKEGVALEFLAKGYSVFLLEYSIGFSSREVKETKTTQLDTDNRYPKPVLEMFETIHFVRQHADDYSVDPDKLFLLGFSAGGHLCASAGIFWNDPSFTDLLSFVPEGDELRATGMVLCYPMLNASPERVLEINNPGNIDTALVKEFMFRTQEPTREQIDAVNLAKQAGKDTIPTFIWHSTDDPVVDSMESTRFILSLQEAGVDCEYHLYDRGGHGLGLCNKVYARRDDEVAPDLAVWTTMADVWMSRI